jgi:hypothetical protein
VRRGPSGSVARVRSVACHCFLGKQLARVNGHNHEWKKASRDFVQSEMLYVKVCVCCGLQISRPITGARQRREQRDMSGQKLSNDI